MLLAAKHEADSLRSKHRLAEVGFCNGFEFLDGDFLCVRYDHLGNPPTTESPPLCLCAKIVETTHISVN